MGKLIISMNKKLSIVITLIVLITINSGILLPMLFDNHKVNPVPLNQDNFGDEVNLLFEERKCKKNLTN